MTAQIVEVGGHGNMIWLFGGAVLAVLLVAAIIVAGVVAIKRFLDA